MCQNPLLQWPRWINYGSLGGEIFDAQLKVWPESAELEQWNLTLIPKRRKLMQTGIFRSKLGAHMYYFLFPEAFFLCIYGVHFPRYHIVGTENRPTLRGNDVVMRLFLLLTWWLSYPSILLAMVNCILYVCMAIVFQERHTRMEHRGSP